MANLSNVVYEFTVALEASADADAAVKEAVIHADVYEEMNASGGTKFIRVDDLIGSTPIPIGGGSLQEMNAVLDVQFVQIPATQGLDDRLAARQTVDQMALEFVTALFNDRNLGTNNCEIVRGFTAQKFNDWRKVGNVKTPISIVRLTLNPDRNI